MLGAYFAQARTYDAANRRFMQADPLAGKITRPISLNPYLYCEDDPVNNIDPTGMAMPGDENLGLTAAQTAAIAVLSDKWFAAQAAGDTAGMAAAHAAANAIRDNAGSGTGSSGSSSSSSSRNSGSSSGSGSNAAQQWGRATAGMPPSPFSILVRAVAVSNTVLPLSQVMKTAGAWLSAVGSARNPVIGTGSSEFQIRALGYAGGSVFTQHGTLDSEISGLQLFNYGLEFGFESDTHKILKDINMRMELAKDEAERIRLARIAQDAIRLERAKTPYKYGQEVVMQTLHENAQTGIAMLESSMDFAVSYVWFVGMTESQWNYKWDSDWQVEHGSFEGEDMNEKQSNGGYRKNWTNWIYFEGALWGADKIGNINLGYVGTKMGFPSYMLAIPYITLDKDDGPAVNLGISLAQRGR